VPPMLDRSKGRGQTKLVSDPPGWGLGLEFTTPPRKYHCYETMEEAKTHTGASKEEVMRQKP
jgi:hypothetical protein